MCAKIRVFFGTTKCLIKNLLKIEYTHGKSLNINDLKSIKLSKYICSFYLFIRYISCLNFCAH